MTYRLHYGLQTGGAVVRAALAEIGTPHDVILTDVRTGAHLSDTYSALNPRQQVPTLIFPDGQVMTESSAILVHLADRHPDTGLLPPPGSAPRGQALRWLAFCATNLYEGENRKLHSERYTIGEPGGVGTAARDFIDRNYLVLETAFSSGPFLLGEACRSPISTSGCWLSGIMISSGSIAVAARSSGASRTSWNARVSPGCTMNSSAQASG